MADRSSYKTTLFDREGPDAGIKLKAFAYSLIAGGTSIVGAALIGAKAELNPLLFLGVVIGIPPLLTYTVYKMSMRAMDSVGHAVNVVVAGGASTPYREQYSYQQALVMQGRLAEALESFEAIIAEPNSTTDVRMRAAELYVREAKQYQRARAAEAARRSLSQHSGREPGARSDSHPESANAA